MASFLHRHTVIILRAADAAGSAAKALVLGFLGKGSHRPSLCSQEILPGEKDPGFNGM
jgi:hypothetical protein